MTYKEFYIWLDGYLHNKLESKHVDIAPIIQKMSQVKDEDSFDFFKQREEFRTKMPNITIPKPPNAPNIIFKKDDKQDSSF